MSTMRASRRHPAGRSLPASSPRKRIESSRPRSSSRALRSFRRMATRTTNAARSTPSHPSFKSLLKLVDTGRCWVKLSAAYEVSKSGPPKYEDVGALAKALVKAAPERMLWASNWPHPTAPKNAMPDDANLLDLLLEWAPDERVRRRILVDNPAELYGFG